LEYKAAAKIEDKDGIGKSVSSMANAAGGVIVIGMIENEEKKPGPIDPVKERKDEYLDQVIGSRIAPPPKCRIHSIEVDGGYVYILEVERGETAHQLKADRRYHKRENTTTRWMEDYEIRDVMGRSKNPAVSVRLERIGRTIAVHLVNDGYIFAQHVRCELAVPKHFLFEPWLKTIDIDGQAYCVKDFFTRSVIHPKSEINATEIVLSHDVFGGMKYATVKETDGPLISWKAWADNAPLREGQINLVDIALSNS